MNTLDNYLPTLVVSLAISAVVFFVTRAFSKVSAISLRYEFVSRICQRLGSAQAIDKAFIFVAFATMIGLAAESLHQYQAFGSYPDFNYFDGILSAVLHGGSLDFIHNRRFNPILSAFVPSYALWSDPRVFLLIQALGLAITVFPIYWFARQQVGRLLALVIAVGYVVSPYVRALNQPAFYEIKLAVPLLAFTLFFLLRNRYMPFLICLGISLLVKQEIAFVAVGFAVFIFLVQRKYILGFTLAASGIALAFFVIAILYPSLNSGKPYPVFEERYAYLGHTLDQVLRALIQRPQIVLEHLLIPLKIDFVSHLLVPLAFLPLLGFEITAIALPTLAYTLLSDLPQQFDPNQYYQSPLVPFLFFGTVVGLQRLLKWASSGKIAHLKFVLFVFLFANFQLYLPSVWTRLFNPANFILDPHNALGHELIRQIPSNATVVAQTELFMPIFGEHRDAVLEFNPSSDYRGDLATADVFLFGDSTRTWYKVHQADWEHWRASGYFDTLFNQDGYFLLRRKSFPFRKPLENGWTLLGSTANPTKFQLDNGWGLLGQIDRADPFLRQLGLEFDGRLTLLGYAIVPSETARGGESVRLVVEWRANSDLLEHYIVVARLLDDRWHLWAEESREPAHGLVPTERWRAGDILRDIYTLELPITIPPGEYRLTIGLWDPKNEQSLEVTDAQGRSVGPEAVVSSVSVKKNTSDVPASYLPIERPSYIDWQEVRLLGTTAVPATLATGEQLQVGLYWRAREKPLGDYVVSMELRNSEGNSMMEETARPAAGAYPTNLWQKGEVLLDWHDLTIPTNLRAGEYTLTVVLRNAIDRKDLGQAAIAKLRIENK